MTGRYLECDFCKKHLDLHVSSHPDTFEIDKQRRLKAALEASNWIFEGQQHTPDELTFCCAEHQRCYHQAQNRSEGK